MRGRKNFPANVTIRILIDLLLLVDKKSPFHSNETQIDLGIPVYMVFSPGEVLYVQHPLLSPSANSPPYS
jgi:hypothetical protein